MSDHFAAQWYECGNYGITQLSQRVHESFCRRLQFCKCYKSKKGHHIVTAFLTKSSADYFFFLAAFLAGFFAAFFADFFAVFAIAFKV
jgi:hypothetical protein